jgi:hypothetical protein
VNGSNAVLGGLPFAATNTMAFFPISIGYTTATLATFAMVVGNGTTINLYRAGAATLNSQMSTHQIYVGGVYEVATA